MNATVTLDEVLAAASARAASLVPETSGYLALAIGDATARLPFRVRDRAVQLTTEGTVTVARGKEVVRDAEAAFVLRDILARLLSVSTGTMRGLSTAARPRGAAEGSIDDLLREIEAALIPVNRTAARRALARLARETLRAKEAGALGAAPKAAKLADARRAEPPPAPAPARMRPADVPVPSEVPAPVAAPSRYDEEWDAEDGAPVDAEGAPTPTEIGMSIVEESPPAEAASDDPDGAASEDPAEAASDEPAAAVDPLRDPAAMVAAVRRNPQAPRRSGEARTPPPAPADPLLSRAQKRSRVDDLVDRFASAPDEDVAMRSAARSLRAFAGLDATPPPLGVVTLASPSPRPPKAAEPEAPEESGPRLAAGRADDEEALVPSLPAPRPARARLAVPLLLVVLGLAGTVAWHFQESLRAALSLSRL